MEEIMKSINEMIKTGKDLHSMIDGYDKKCNQLLEQIKESANVSKGVNIPIELFYGIIQNLEYAHNIGMCNEKVYDQVKDIYNSQVKPKVSFKPEEIMGIPTLKHTPKKSTIKLDTDNSNEIPVSRYKGNENNQSNEEDGIKYYDNIIDAIRDFVLF